MIKELSETTITAILDIINRGNDAEVKKVNNHLVVVEIRRKVKDKTAANGQ